MMKLLKKLKNKLFKAQKKLRTVFLAFDFIKKKVINVLNSALISFRLFFTFLPQRKRQMLIKDQRQIKMIPISSLSKTKRFEVQTLNQGKDGKTKLNIQDIKNDITNLNKNITDFNNKLDEKTSQLSNQTKEKALEVQHLTQKVKFKNLHLVPELHTTQIKAKSQNKNIKTRQTQLSTNQIDENDSGNDLLEAFEIFSSLLTTLPQLSAIKDAVSNIIQASISVYAQASYVPTR